VLDADLAQWGVPVLRKPLTLGDLAGVCAPFWRTAAPLKVEV
jgi:hypothetical protein